MSGEGHRILAVEDEPDILNIIQIYLRRWGFIVDGFTDPLEALARFREDAGIYSLVLTDIRMPHMTGLELAHELQKIRADVKIVLMTAFEVTPRDLETMLPLLKYDDILLKPFNLVRICNAIKKQLQTTTT